MKTSKSSSADRFVVGDPVLYSFIRKGRRITLQVTVSEVHTKAFLDTETSAPVMWELESYVVSSGRGGQVRASPAELRPDTGPGPHRCSP